VCTSRLLLLVPLILVSSPRCFFKIKKRATSQPLGPPRQETETGGAAARASEEVNKKIITEDQHCTGQHQEASSCHHDVRMNE
jgi:hypothetical protein